MKNINALILNPWNLFLALSLALTPLSASYTDTLEKTFTTDGIGLLSMEFSGGPIEFNTYDGADVSVVIERTIRSGEKEDFEEAEELIESSFDQSGNNITVIHKYQNQNKRFWGLFSGKKKLHFKTKVTLPRQFNVNARTSGGKIQLANLTGKANLRTSGGSISVNKLTGPAYLKTSGGGITVKNSNGDMDLGTSGGKIKIEGTVGALKAKTSGGGIYVEDVTGDAKVSTSGGPIEIGIVKGNLTASTSGGSINAKLAGQPSEDCYLKTSGGGIRIAVDPSANLFIDASTSGGGVNSNLTLSDIQLKKSSLSGQMNEGGPTLKVRTSGGSIHIHSI